MGTIALQQYVKVSKGVEKLKEKVQRQNISAKTKRKIVTDKDFIASQKGRQEFEPLICSFSFISRIHVEPLHLQNNDCQQLFQEILYEYWKIRPNITCLKLHSHNQRFSFAELRHLTYVPFIPLSLRSFVQRKYSSK